MKSVRSTAAASISFAVVALSGAACVPPGNSTPSDAGPTAASAAAQRDPAAFVPSIGIMTTTFEDNFDRKPAAPAAAPSGSSLSSATPAPPSMTGSDAASLIPGAASDGGRSRRAVDDAGVVVTSPTVIEAPDAAVPVSAVNELGPDWTPTDPSAWHLEHGKVCGQHAKNHGLWLNRVLPINARIEFDAVAETDDGDLKGEFWGDGKSFATSLSYTNATGYLAIMGGWHNTFDVIARHNEHGTDRKELKIDKTSDDPAEKPVEPGQTYRFKVERVDGKTVRFAVNNIDLLSYTDMDPVKGAGHDHFAFNDWDAKVCFDNLKITPASVSDSGMQRVRRDARARGTLAIPWPPSRPNKNCW